MTNKDEMFYLNLFENEENQKVKENLKQIDFKNKNPIKLEVEQDLNDFDFSKIGNQ